MGVLKSTEMIDVYEAFLGSAFSPDGPAHLVTVEILKDALKAKNWAVPDNFLESEFYKDLITSTNGGFGGTIRTNRENFGEALPWDELNAGLQQAVFSRILRLPTNPVVMEDDVVDLKRYRVERWNRPEGLTQREWVVEQMIRDGILPPHYTGPPDLKIVDEEDFERFEAWAIKQEEHEEFSRLWEEGYQREHADWTDEDWDAIEFDEQGRGVDYYSAWTPNDETTDWMDIETKKLRLAREGVTEEEVLGRAEQELGIELPREPKEADIPGTEGWTLEPPSGQWHPVAGVIPGSAFSPETDLERDVASAEKRLRSKKLPPRVVKRWELRNLQLKSPLHQYKSAVQEAQDLKNLEEARNRAMKWIDKIKEEIRKRNIPDLKKISFTIDADVGALMSQVEDITINGAFTKDANGKSIYRASYEDGAVASLQNYGTQLVFNLSQIEKQYGQRLDTDIDTLIKDTTVHEGTHIHVLKDLLDSERQALKTYGKKQHVPKEVSQHAAKQKLTWREYVAEQYDDLSDADLTEETSVQILDALAQGKVPDSKSAGTIGKIKRELKSRFEIMVGTARDSHILPVLRIFEGIQNRDILQRREGNDSLAEKAGSLQLVERADPKDLVRLKDAIKEGDKDKIAQVADEIIESRLKPVEERTKKPTEVLLESLVNDLRARREVGDTPTGIVNSVLNKEALRDGTVSPEALDAYFRFRDGRKPAYRMPLEARERRWGTSSHIISPEVESFVAGVIESGLISESNPAGYQAIAAMDSHMLKVEKGLKAEDKFVGSAKDMRELVDYTRGQLFRKRFLDKRLPMWKSSKRAYSRYLPAHH